MQFVQSEKGSVFIFIQRGIPPIEFTVFSQLLDENAYKAKK
jgi:hypothetical protein